MLRRCDNCKKWFVVKDVSNTKTGRVEWKLEAYEQDNDAPILGGGWYSVLYEEIKARRKYKKCGAETEKVEWTLDYGGTSERFKRGKRDLVSTLSLLF